MEFLGIPPWLEKFVIMVMFFTCMVYLGDIAKEIGKLRVTIERMK